MRMGEERRVGSGEEGKLGRGMREHSNMFRRRCCCSYCSCCSCCNVLHAARQCCICHPPRHSSLGADRPSGEKILRKKNEWFSHAGIISSSSSSSTQRAVCAEPMLGLRCESVCPHTPTHLAPSYSYISSVLILLHYCICVLILLNVSSQDRPDRLRAPQKKMGEEEG